MCWVEVVQANEVGEALDLVAVSTIPNQAAQTEILGSLVLSTLVHPRSDLVSTPCSRERDHGHLQNLPEYASTKKADEGAQAKTGTEASPDETAG